MKFCDQSWKMEVDFEKEEFQYSDPTQDGQVHMDAFLASSTQLLGVIGKTEFLIESCAAHFTGSFIWGSGRLNRRKIYLHYLVL